MKYKKAAIMMAISQPIVLICLYCVIIFGQILYMPGVEYSNYTNTKNETQMPHNADVVVIGDSRAKAGFIPNENIKNSSINLAVGGSSPIVGFYTLKKYLKNNKPPKVVVMSYMSGHLNISETTFWQMAVKYKFLTIEEIKEVLENARHFNECKFFINNGGGCTTIDIYKYLFNIRNFSAELYNANFFATYRDNINGIERLKQSRGHCFYGQRLSADGNFAEASYRQFIIDKLSSEYLHKLSVLAKQNNIKLAFYVMPHNQTTENNLNKKFMYGYKAFIKHMQKNYDIVPLNEPYAMPNEAFGDHSHPYKGAKQVTQDIWKKLDEKGLLD